MGARGKPKTGGRQKGTPNKVNAELQERCSKRGNDPFDVMLDILDDDEASSGLKFAAAKELCQYVYPKRKALEIDVNADLAEQAEDFEQRSEADKIKILEATLKRLKAGK